MSHPSEDRNSRTRFIGLVEVRLVGSETDVRRVLDVLEEIFTLHGGKPQLRPTNGPGNNKRAYAYISRKYPLTGGIK